MDRLEELQRQLAAITNQAHQNMGQYGMPLPAPVVKPPALSPDLAELVKKEVQQIMAPIAAELKKESASQQMMISSIGEIFNKEQQDWLSSNLGALPAFLASSNGKSVMHLVLEEFQKFVKPN